LVVLISDGINPSYVGQAVVFSAVVSGRGTAPSGSVSFEEGKTILGTSPLDDGKATFTSTFVKSGTPSVTASYSGDQNYKTKNSRAIKEIVKQYTTNTVMISGPNPSTYGQSITFTATVSSMGPTPTGTVTFANGSKSLGKVALSGGAATIAVSTLAAGTSTISASYSGDASNAKSTSSLLIQTVDQAASTTSIVSSVNPSQTGKKAKFTATVVSPTTTPTGVVTFMDGSATLGSGNLQKGRASYSSSTLSAGSHNITAVYVGTQNV
jgi:Bacterial Ig-like domain (group 3)